MFARPGLPEFDYVRPSTREEVARLLETCGGAARLLMGGTDLLPKLRDGSIWADGCASLQPRLVVDLKGLPDLRETRVDELGRLVVGAAVTLNLLAVHEAIRTDYPLLAESANTVASYQIRNRATLGGNLCNASPAADTAPAVLVLEGEMVLYGPAGERAVPAGSFFLGPGRTALQAGEFLTAVRFPQPLANGAGRYLKLGRRKGGDLSVASVAALAFEDQRAQGGYRFRLGLGSVGPVPFRTSEAEGTLAAGPPGETLFALAAVQASAASSPISDVRATAEYQTAMVRVLVLRALRDVWRRLREGD